MQTMCSKLSSGDISKRDSVSQNPSTTQVKISGFIWKTGHMVSLFCASLAIHLLYVSNTSSTKL